MRALNQPTSWWGWHWEPPVPMSIIELIRAGNLNARLAALLWIAMERGASLIVAADPPSSGKTTTLSALLAFTPPDTTAYFTRGEGETFSLPPRSDAYPTYILINEMSDHIPVYTWDDNARRAFQLLADGYSMATTMHDETVEGVIRQLRADLRIPAEHIAKLTFVMTMYVVRLGGMMRRIKEVAMLDRDGEELSVSRIAGWDLNSDSLEVLPKPEHREKFGRWAGLSVEAVDAELEKRAGFLTTLLNTGVTSIPEVNAAIESFYEEAIKPRPQA
jgi:type IV secretory pathway ATPase VirB11/archaellum biosynthesis ATPase